MPQEIVTALIAGVVGLVTGAIGSLVAPWVNWGIEKRRKRHDNRAELISTWRKIIGGSNFERHHMTGHPSYGTLKPLLSPDAQKQLGRPTNHHIIVQGGSGASDADRAVLQREIARIEREWELV